MELSELLHRSPHVAGLSRSRWWLAGIRQSVVWLQERSLSGIWSLLKRLKLSYKRGRTYLHSPDPDYDAKLNRLQLALEQARQNPERYVFLYEDEMSYYRRPSLAQAYGQVAADDVRAHCGLRANSARRVAACLNALTGQVIAWQRSSFRLKTLLAFWRAVEAAYPHAQTIFVALDNWPVHFHAFIRSALADSRLVFLPLPTYAPWTNPVEKLWRKLRQEVLHLHPFVDDWPALQAAVDAWLFQFKDRSTDLLRYVGL